MSPRRYNRRELLRIGALSGAGTVIASRRSWAQVCVDQTPTDIENVAFTGCGIDGEPMATSPFIVNPYQQDLPIPQALRPGYRTADLLAPLAGPTDTKWLVRKSVQFGNNTVVPPGPAPGQQDALGDRPGVHNNPNSPGYHPEWKIPNAGTHQLWTHGTGASGVTLNYPDPILYHIRLQVSTHQFTNSPVVPIDVNGNAITPPPNAGSPVGRTSWHGIQVPTYAVPASTIYGFNGTFPGPLLNIDYQRPALVRFENDLDRNPLCLDRQDFGAPDWAFLTHLHNGHTAPESDGQPHHAGETHGGGYQPAEWVDNLYLAYPAGNDDREKQSFLWFHDHRMHHTGPNVYKGMVGIAPHYDPFNVDGTPGLDPGDETKGLRLPGVRTNNLDASGNPDGSFNVKYDIPLVFYDMRLDDGITPHQDEHTAPANCGLSHPEWWGKSFFQHYVNHGFVGDIQTVNGAAFPTLVVERRKYRFRFLDASVSRQYSLSVRKGTPMAFPGTQGQWLFGNVQNGVQNTDKGTYGFKWYEIASEGGLLPNVQTKCEIEIWPAKRREAIIDFTTDVQGHPTQVGDVFYLCNTAQMLDGRKQTTSGDIGFDAQYCVALMKIVIGNPPAVPDYSLIPGAKQLLRASPPFDPNASQTPGRNFTLQRGSPANLVAGETQWVINSLQFDPFNPQAVPFVGSAEVWGINNGGGGWTHPMHLHMEEHHVIWRSTNLAVNQEDTGKEDVVALQPSESTNIYRRFRTFIGNYVAHCHNLLHEDHNMMFGWTIRNF